MIKSNKEVTLKTRETYFNHRKPQKPKFAEKYFPKIVFRKIDIFFHSVSRIVPKRKQNWPGIAAMIKEVFPVKIGKDESKLSFLRFS